MAEGIVEDTVTVVEKYPVWILGGLLVAVLLFWWLSGSSASKAPAQFQFSYGPSDAQVTAGAAEQIAQTQAMQAATVAQTQANAGVAIAGNYYDYLTTNSANQLALGMNTNDVTQAVDLASINGQVQMTQAEQAAQTTAAIAASNAAVQIAATQAQSAKDVAYQQAMASVQASNVVGYVAQQQAAAAETAAYWAAEAKINT